MSGLDRRTFLKVSAALSASLGLSYSMTGSALAAPLAPGVEGPSTLQETIRQRTVGNLQYRTLVTGSGEPYLPRLDILRKEPGADRVKNRRSIGYLGHLSDIHMIDAQTPARVEPLLAEGDAEDGDDPGVAAGELDDERGVAGLHEHLARHVGPRLHVVM
ncbi:MAG: hypothetical protein HQ526_11425, partial [Actinobacteria bacterium]|nr:hypothetical protein [Actinomycetota bacterium]